MHWIVLRGILIRRMLREVLSPWILTSGVLISRVLSPRVLVGGLRRLIVVSSKVAGLDARSVVSFGVL